MSKYPSTARINRVQGLQFDLLKEAIGDELAQEISVDLIANRQLWRAAIVDRQPTLPERLPVDYIKLRDLHERQWNADTLFVALDGPQSAIEAQFARFQELARKWEADECTLYRRVPGIPAVVRVWWDF